jgi:hypothetical protein
MAHNVTTTRNWPSACCRQQAVPHLQEWAQRHTKELLEPMDLLNHLPEVLQMLFLAVLQGMTELFSVSSPGQSIIIPGGIRC